jgi:hypothetical protein
MAKRVAIDFRSKFCLRRAISLALRLLGRLVGIGGNIVALHPHHLDFLRRPRTDQHGQILMAGDAALTVEPFGVHRLIVFQRLEFALGLRIAGDYAVDEGR